MTIIPQLEPVECNGFLLFNDPHAGSRRPSTRKDKSYADAILKKYQQIVDIANKRRLVPICSGDWFHRAHEEDDAIKTRILRISRGLWTRAGISNVGNHDMRGLTLADGDTLSILKESDYYTVASSNGPVREFIIKGEDGDYRVGVGCTPYGMEIPQAVGHHFPKADGVIWITHHDLAFDGAYPGAVTPFHIEGCSILWNGHMHLEKPTVMEDETMWCNMGSIGRTAIDAIHHEPCAWEFNADEGLVRHRLEHQKDVFDLGSNLVSEISPGEHVAYEDMAFVDLLNQDLDAAPLPTEEGTHLLGAIREKFSRDSTDTAVKSIILDYLNTVTKAEGALAATA